MTATGEPATERHLLRYTLVLGIVGIGIWICANLAGNHTIGIWLSRTLDVQFQLSPRSQVVNGHITGST